MNKSTTLYLIPGLGADDRLFSRLTIKKVNMVCLKWEMPLWQDTLESFALKLAKQMDTSKPFSLLGVSFGGMLATEIAKVYPPEKLVLVSSCKNKFELPWYFRMFRYVPIYYILPVGLVAKSLVLGKNLIGALKNDEMKIFAEMAHDINPKFMRVSIHLVVNWRNKEGYAGTVHYHGNKDRLLPRGFTKNTIEIDGGTHFMVISKATELNSKLNQLFS